MATPETRLGGFIAYTTARPSSRASAIKLAIGGDYDGVKDHYLRFRRAVEADRRGGRDGSAIAAAVANATEKKVASFKVLAKNWPSIAKRWAACAPANVDDARVTIAGLEILVKPSFVEQHADGTIEIVVMGYAAAKHDTASLDAIVRLVQRAYTPAYPNATVTYVDLYNKRVRTSSGRDLSVHDTRIDTDAAGLAYGMRNAAAA